MCTLTERNTIRPGQKVVPVRERAEAIVKRNEWTFAITCDVTHHVVHLEVAVPDVSKRKNTMAKISALTSWS
jgi:hypothetical protein